MKKYLMTGIAAIAMCAAFTSCSRDFDYEQTTPGQQVQEKYNRAFLNYLGVESIDPDQDWGFSATRGITRSGNTGETYPATHEYTANGTVIAGANMNHNEWADPNKEFGGWVVPDALTDGQKLRVQKYFQANPNLSYEDPHLRHFFVQQVYTGGTSAPETGNKESTVGADGQAHKGMTLNQLTVGEACSHINDFNAGTCSTSSVLDNGKTVNNGTYHSDQITLMVNVDDTSCFGYHETSGSNVNPNNNHNDKMALVDAATIDAWAAQNGNPGEAVVDKWNRSFMGFDYELLPESDIVTDTYAMLSNWDGNRPQYAWDGTDVMVIGSAPEATQAEEVDVTSTFAKNPTELQNVTCSYDSNGNIVCNFAGQYYNSITFAQNGANWTSYDKLVIEFAEASPINATLTNRDGVDVQIKVGDTKVEIATPNYTYNGNGPCISNQGIGNGGNLTLKIKSVKLVKEASAPDSSVKYYTSQYLLAGGTDQISFYSRNTNMYGGVIKNVSSSDMTTTVGGKTCINLKWIKEELLDKGYHPITTDLKQWVKWQAACDGYYSDWIVTLTEAKRQVVEQYDLMIIAEDLSATERSDFDFNDVVLEVKYGSPAKVKLTHAGGTLPLVIVTDTEIADAVETIDDTYEVHDLFGVGRNEMVNTGKGPNKSAVLLNDKGLRVNIANAAEANTKLRLFVYKAGAWQEMKAPKGEPASKLAVGIDFKVLTERKSIKDEYELFLDWATSAGFSSKWW